MMIVARGHAKPDAICYNALINVSVKAEDITAAREYLDYMLETGVQPSVVSYTTVLHAYARSGNCTEAERGLKLMLENGVEANVVSYGALIHACVKAGDIDRAEYWFEKMRSVGIQANAVSYSSLLNVCAKAGDVGRAERWLANMASDGVPPNVVCINNVIDACARAGRGQRAEAWLWLVAHGTSGGRGSCSGGPAPVQVVNPLRIGHESGAGSSSRGSESALTEDGKEAAEVVERVRRSMPHIVWGITASRLSFTAAAQAHATHGSWSDVERIFAEMECYGMSLDEFGLTVLLTAYSKARPRQRMRAEALFTSYVKHDLKITMPPLRALKMALEKERAEQLSEKLGVRVAA